MATPDSPDWVLPGQGLEDEAPGRDRLYTWLTLVALIISLGACCGAGIGLGVALA